MVSTQHITSSMILMACLLFTVVMSADGHLVEEHIDRAPVRRRRAGSSHRRYLHGKGSSKKSGGKSGGKGSSSIDDSEAATGDENILDDKENAIGTDTDLNVGDPSWQAPQRMINIKRTGDTTKCVAYDASDTESPVLIVDCASSSDMAVWEVIEESFTLFKLRHQASGQCLPQNPELPDRSFDCWVPQESQAIADSINGLVDCTSDHAAVLGFTDPSNTMSIYNTVCSGAVATESDVLLMAYTNDGATVVLWGEKILLEMPQMVDSDYNLSGDWYFDDV